MARCASIILLVVASAADVVGAFRAQPSSIHHRITESRPTASSLGLPRGIIAAKEGKEQRGRGDFALSFLRSDVDAAGELSAEVAIDIDAELAFIARRNVLLAGEEIATMETALWRWVHEEEEEEEGNVSTTDESIIESIANMLLERPYVSLPTTSSTHIVQKYM
jgi:hypothetical protein